MKRIVFSLMAAAVASSAIVVFAAEAPKTAKTETKAKEAMSGMKADEHQVETLKGEIVDTGCYLGHEAKGADHKSCALRCISGGMPMGLLTEDGTVYLLLMSHDDAAPFNAAKELAAEMVAITGPVMDRGGLHAIEVTKIEKTAVKKS